ATLGVEVAAGEGEGDEVEVGAVVEPPPPQPSTPAAANEPRRKMTSRRAGSDAVSAAFACWPLFIVTPVFPVDRPSFLRRGACKARTSRPRPHPDETPAAGRGAAPAGSALRPLPRTRSSLDGDGGGL